VAENKAITRKGADKLALGALAVGGLVLLVLITGSYWERIARGHTDFLSFYAGGKLAFTRDLYVPAKSMEEQARASGVVAVGAYFIRMPWFAAAMWPLARLPYVPAQLIWQAILLGGIVTFAALWPRPAPPIRLVIFCFSVPSLMNLIMGQDVPLLLAWMAIALVLLDREKPVAAGLVLSLTLAKFHLFLPIFLAVLFARRWKFAQGLFGGSAILLGLSFLVSGPTWPREYLTAISNPETTPTTAMTPSFYYFIPGDERTRTFVMLAIGAVLMLLYLRIAMRKNAEYLIAAAPLVILPVLPHAGAYDTLVLTPLAMTAVASGTKPAKFVAVLLLTPLAYFATWSGPPFSILLPILDVALLAMCALQPEPATESVPVRESPPIASQLY
jgi:hypothetical protein